jgi:hypothetical protein
MHRKWKSDSDAHQCVQIILRRRRRVCKEENTETQGVLRERVTNMHPLAAVCGLT